MRQYSVANVLVVSATLTMIVLGGCGRDTSHAESADHREKTSQQGSDQTAAIANQSSNPKDVGESAALGSFLVTLNGAKSYFAGDNEDENVDVDGHHYAVVDLTLENRSQESVDASIANYLLRDEQGYSFETKTLSEQRSKPEGQVVPGGKASGEVAFDLGKETPEGPLTLFVSLSRHPEVPPATFECKVKIAEKGPKPKPEEPKKEEKAGSTIEPGYEVLKDPSGGLSVEIPTAWQTETGSDSEGQGGPKSWSYYAGEYITSSITTAQSLDSWYEGQGNEQGSGAYIVASKSLAQKYTDDELIHSLLFEKKANKCSAGPYEDFESSSYSGKMQTWYGCLGYDNTFFIVAAAPESRECVVVLSAKISPGADEADRQAVQHILDSFEVDCDKVTSEALSSTEQKAEPAPQPSSPQPPPSPESGSITLSGTGSQATDFFTLESGLAVFDMSHEGESNFIATLYNEHGEEISYALANEIGTVTITNAVRIPSDGGYVLDVEGDGPWQIEVSQPRPSDAPEKTSFSGENNAATDLFRLSAGLKKVHMTHQGEGNFIVTLLDHEGREVEFALANDIGTVDVSSTAIIPSDGLYLFTVEAEGPWTIRIE